MSDCEIFKFSAMQIYVFMSRYKKESYKVEITDESILAFYANSAYDPFAVYNPKWIKCAEVRWQDFCMEFTA